MLYFPLSAFFGLANLTYACLNFQLLKGLGKLEDSEKPDQPQSVGPSSIPSPLTTPLCTVLIAARNEENRLPKCLVCLSLQDYPKDRLQIVVVNDRSTDATEKILNDWSQKFAGQLKVIHITESKAGFSPKKYALSEGLKIATGEFILTTDADCIMSPQWISSIVSEFKPETGLVLGMTSYYPMDKKDLAWGTQALEFLSYGIVAAALIGLKFPVHGNANNIAYRRKVYDASTGIAAHASIVSGDDDFLIQGIHKLGDWKIHYSVKKASQVQTEPPLSWKQFWEQRKRWASKCSFYEPKQTLFLAGIFAYYALIPIFLLAGLFDSFFLVLGVGGFVVKTGTDFLVMKKGTRIFYKQELMQWFFSTSVIHIPVIIAAVVAGSFGEFTWRDTAVRKKV